MAQEVIEIIDTFTKEAGKIALMISNDGLSECIEALEKQIPKKPFEHWLEGMAVPLHECPVCHKQISRWVDGCFYKLPTCYCGQKIDWSDDEWI